MEKKDQRFLIKYFWMKNLGSKQGHQEPVITLGADAYGRPRIKIWIQNFRNSDLSCKEAPRTGRPPLTLRPQLAAFLQKDPCASTRVLAQHCLASLPTIKEMSSERAGIEEILAGPGATFSVSHPKIACVEASTEMLRILYKSEENHFEEIATGD